MQFDIRAHELARLNLPTTILRRLADQFYAAKPAHALGTLECQQGWEDDVWWDSGYAELFIRDLALADFGEPMRGVRYDPPFEEQRQRYAVSTVETFKAQFA